MICCRTLIITGLMVCYCFCTIVSGEAGAVKEFQDYMRDLEFQASKEGEIPLSKFGKSAYAEGVCKSQNLAEKGYYAEAAAILEALVTDEVKSRSQQIPTERIEILKKWAETSCVELEDYRTFFVKTGPDWFRKRITPVVNAFHNQDFPQVEKHLLIAEFLEEMEDTTGYILALSVIPELEGVEKESAAKALLAIGIAYHDIGDAHKAEECWMKVRKHPGVKSVWSKAVFNLGILHKEQKEYQEAIDFFAELLESEPGDKESGAHLMEVYRNYSHRCAIEISMSYESMGEYHKSLRYAWLAKKRYRYVSWCGTCQRSAEWALNKRILYLTARAYGVWVLVIVLGIYCVRSYRKKRKRSNQCAGADVTDMAC